MKCRLFHNPHFVQYTLSNQNDAYLQIPASPTAVFTLPTATMQQDPLTWIFRYSQHLGEQPWYKHDTVQLPIRSTSVGDLIVDPNNNIFVVERVGFRKLERSSHVQ